MRLSIDFHSRPSVLNDLDVCRVNVLVSIDEMICKNGSEQLRRIDGMLLGDDVRGLLHGVSRDYDTVVRFGVPELS